MAGTEALLELLALFDDGDFDAYWRYHLARKHERLYPTPDQHTYERTAPEQERPRRRATPVAKWLARSRQRTGREPGGGFAAPRPALFPGAGGGHRQRAFRDPLGDPLPSEHDWLFHDPPE
ncbi:hypothetical protein [Streptomyces sp. NPDC017991]|uniref:hypothetical protein n=1 Tax=Streptomyces sp. NPDC017991 TaxID=3365026 RepID=UPI0037A25230